MEGQHKRLPDSGKGISISPLSPFPPVQSQTHEPTLRVPSSVRSAMFIVTPTPDARPSSFWSGMNGILHPTALQWWGRQHEPMPLRWSLADAVASVAINMPLQKELFASSRKGRSISPLSPFPPVQPQTHEPTLRVPSSVRSAMFIVTPTLDAWPSSSGAA